MTEGDDENQTTDTRVRWEHWGTVAAFVILVSTYLTWVWLLYTRQTVPQQLGWTVYTGAILALIWTFGKQTVEALTRLKNGR